MLSTLKLCFKANYRICIKQTCKHVYSGGENGEKNALISAKRHTGNILKNKTPNCGPTIAKLQERKRRFNKILNYAIENVSSLFPHAMQ